MRIDPDRYVPMGIDGAVSLRRLGWCMGAGSIWSLLYFIGSYSDAYDSLWHHRGSLRIMLREGAIMPGFFEILSGSETVFLMVCAAMPFWALYHYSYHFNGSKSIYLMRRLPESWELHRRCLVGPAVGLLGALSLQGLLGVLYCLIYIFVTPRQCLPF